MNFKKHGSNGFLFRKVEFHVKIFWIRVMKFAKKIQFAKNELV